MAAHKNPLWLLIIFCFLIVYCGVHMNLSDVDWLKVFEKNGDGQRTAYLYVATSSGVYAFRIDSSTGALSQINGSPYNNLIPFTALGALQNNGKILLAGYSGSGKGIHAFPINTDGSLAASGTTSASNEPKSITIDPTGHFAAVCYNGYSYFYLYNINSATNQLSTVTTSGFPYNFGLPTASNPLISAFSPDGQWLVAGLDTAKISAFQIDQVNGIIASPKDYTSGTNNASFILFHPSGNCFYVGDHSTTPPVIYCYPSSLGGGNLPILSSYTNLGDGTIDALAIAPNGRYLFSAVNGSLETLSVLPIDANGGLVGTIKTFGLMSHVIKKWVVDSSSRYLYSVAYRMSGEHFIKVFKIGDDATLQELESYAYPFGLDTNSNWIMVQDMVIVYK